MRETPQLPDSPSDCLPCWTTLTGGMQGQLAWSIYSDGHLVVARSTANSTSPPGPAWPSSWIPWLRSAAT